MIADTLRERIKKAPFKPFVVRLTSGLSYVIDHPEIAFVSPGGRHLILYTKPDSYVDIDVLLIEALEDTKRRNGGNGHSNRRRSA